MFVILVININVASMELYSSQFNCFLPKTRSQMLTSDIGGT